MILVLLIVIFIFAESVQCTCKHKPTECNDIFTFSYKTSNERYKYKQGIHIIYLNNRSMEVNIYQILIVNIILNVYFLFL